MGMADPRSYEEIEADFKKRKQQIIDMVSELIAVNALEYHNKNWLSGNNKTRCESVSETLTAISNQLELLSR